MDTPIYEGQIIVGGANQQTLVSILPAEIVTRQSGQINIEAVYPEPDFLPFDLSGVANPDAYVVPIRTSVTPVPLGSGVISYTGERFTITASGTPATAGTFDLTVDGETASGIAFDATGPDILAVLEGLPSRNPGDFEVSVAGGLNLADSGCVVRVDLSGGFAIDDRSFADFTALTADEKPTFSTVVDQSTVQNFYSSTWVKDTIPSTWSTFDPQDRDGSIGLYVELEDGDDFYQFVSQFNVIDGSLSGDQQTQPLVSFLNYYNQIYAYSNVTTDTDPGPGFFRMNSTLISSVTEVYIADENESSVNASSMFQSLGIGSNFYIGNPNLASEAALFQVSGTVVANSGWSTIPVTYVDSGSPSFLNGNRFSISLQSASGSGGGGISFSHEFDPTTTMADPGAEKIRYNNAAPGSVTAIAVSATATNGLDMTAQLKELSPRDLIYCQQVSNSGNYIDTAIIDVVDNTTWFQINLSVSDSGTLPESGEEVGVDLARSSQSRARVNTQVGTAYTLVLGDGGKTISMDNASANTLTIPPESSVDFEVDTEIFPIQLGAGNTTVEGDTGVTVNGVVGGSVSLGGQNSRGYILKKGVDDWLVSTSSVTESVAIYQDQKSASTAGGSSSVGYQTRTLNTEVTDINNLGTLSANAVTLVAGTYSVFGVVTCYRSGAHIGFLNDGTTDILTGTQSYNNALNDIANVTSIISGVIVADGVKAYSVRSHISSAKATNGLGVAGTVGTQVYTTLQFKRLGD